MEEQNEAKDDKKKKKDELLFFPTITLGALTAHRLKYTDGGTINIK